MVHEQERSVEILTDKGRSVPLKGRSLKCFDLRSMEDRLQKNVWIRMRSCSLIITRCCK